VRRPQTQMSQGKGTGLARRRAASSQGKCREPQHQATFRADGKVRMTRRLSCREALVSDTWHETVEDALHQAEFGYGVAPGAWVPAPDAA
jgi:hypothetical protein